MDKNLSGRVGMVVACVVDVNESGDASVRSLNRLTLVISTNIIYECIEEKLAQLGAQIHRKPT